MTTMATPDAPIGGERRIPAPRQTVWHALVDAQVLRGCLPGCQELNQTGPGPHDMQGTARVAVGHAETSLGFQIAFADIDPPDGASVLIAITDGTIGTATLRVGVALDDEGSFTLLRYAADANASGSLAGQGAQTRVIVDRFLDNFTAEVSAPDAIAVDGAAGAMSAAANTNVHQGNPPALVLALAAIPAEIGGFPVVFWGGSFVFLLIFLLVFSAYL